MDIIFDIDKWEKKDIDDNIEKLRKLSIEELAELVKKTKEIDVIKKLEDLVNKKKDEEKDFLNGMTEDEALKRYITKNTKINKGAEMIKNAFKTNIRQINYNNLVSLSFLISRSILEKNNTSFPKIIRSKSHNLKINKELCEDVYSGKITVERFVAMKTDEMKTDEIKKEDQKSIDRTILESRIAECEAETDMFECKRCKTKKCTYSQLQTRSCDEPMTTFVHCTNCGNRWRF